MAFSIKNFFKYNQVTDANKTFNIEDALNKNWDLVNTMGQELDDEISVVNDSLSQEITNRQNEDAKKLPLTGGTLSGGITQTSGYFVQDNNVSTMLLVASTTDDVQLGAFKKTTVGDIDWGNHRILSLRQQNYGLDQALVFVNSISGKGAYYRIYGEHNITVSQSQPGALAEGCQHQVF